MAKFKPSETVSIDAADGAARGPVTVDLFRIVRQCVLGSFRLFPASTSCESPGVVRCRRRELAHQPGPKLPVHRFLNHLIRWRSRPVLLPVVSSLSTASSFHPRSGAPHAIASSVATVIAVSMTRVRRCTSEPGVLSAGCFPAVTWIPSRVSRSFGWAQETIRERVRWVRPLSNSVLTITHTKNPMTTAPTPRNS